MMAYLSSCFTYTWNVGKGAQTGVEVKSKNNYLIAGLVEIGTKSPESLAGGAKDYTVTITHTFIDGLIAAITGNIYTPTTIIVKK